MGKLISGGCLILVWLEKSKVAEKKKYLAQKDQIQPVCQSMFLNQLILAFIKQIIAY